MNPSDVLDFGETDLVTLTTNIDAAILGEDAWEDATDESGVDLECFATRGGELRRLIRVE